MNRIPLGTAFLALLCLHGPGARAQIEYQHGQDVTPGPGERIIYKYETYWGLRDDPAKQYSMGPGGPFPSKSDAEKQLSDKIASTKKHGYWAVTHGLIKRVPYNSTASNSESNADAGTGATVGILNGSSIDVKTPKLVDPGGSANSNTQSTGAKDLVGKNFKGKVGDIQVTFSFVDEQEMTITSGLRSLKAKWSLDGSGQLSLRAFNATFVGSRVGSTFRGKRRPLVNPSLISEWEFDVSDVSTEVERGRVYNDPRTKETQHGKNEFANTAWTRFEYTKGGYADNLHAACLVLYEDKTFSRYGYVSVHGHKSGEEQTIGYYVNANEIKMELEIVGAYSMLDDGTIQLTPTMISKTNKRRIDEDNWNWILRPSEFRRSNDVLKSTGGETLTKGTFYPRVFGSTAANSKGAEYLVKP